MISKFCTLTDRRESRKGRRRKTSDVKTCKKARKKVKEEDYGACLRHQKNKRKEKKNSNEILYKCRHPSHMKRMLYNHDGKNNKLCDQRGQDPEGDQAGKETH